MMNKVKRFRDLIPYDMNKWTKDSKKDAYLEKSIKNFDSSDSFEFQYIHLDKDKKESKFKSFEEFLSLNITDEDIEALIGKIAIYVEQARKKITGAYLDYAIDGFQDFLLDIWKDIIEQDLD